MNVKQNDKTMMKSKTLESIDKLRAAGFGINKSSDGAYAYKVTIHEEKDILTVQNGTIIFRGTWEEVNAFIEGMLYVSQFIFTGKDE